MQERSIIQDAIDAVLSFHYAQKKFIAALCHQAHVQAKFSNSHTYTASECHTYSTSANIMTPSSVPRVRSGKDSKAARKKCEKALHSASQHFFNAHIYTANMSTESFAIIEEEKNNTIVRGFGNEILICEKQTNTTNRANTTDGKRNISIDMREACEISQVRSGNGSKPARKKCGKERQTLWQLIFIMMMLLHVPSASASANQPVVLVKNYTVFQNDTPAIFYCYVSGFENGAAVVVWTLNGARYGSNHAQRGIRVVTDTPIADTVSSQLFIPSNSSIHNNTEVMCKTIDFTSNSILASEPANLTLQGPLDAPSNFSVNTSYTSNTTFLLSWGAPFSLNVTDTVDIYYYTLCTDIGCKNISSDPDCTFPRTCTSSVDFTDSSLNGTNGGQNIMDNSAPIEFTLFAVNGAGKGNVSKPFRFKKESGENIAPSQTEPKSMSIIPTATTLTGNVQNEVPIAVLVAVPVVVCILTVTLVIIAFLVIAIMCRCTKRKPSELPVHVELYSYATHQEKSTLAANQQKTSESHYTAVACHPIISIPAPNDEVQYSEVKPQNDKPKLGPNGYMEVVCHPVISIPAPHHEVQYSEAVNTTLNPRRVECDSEENGNEGDSRWCHISDPAKQDTTAHIAPGVDLDRVVKHADASASQRILQEHTEHHRTLSSDLSDIKPFIQDPYYNPCERIAYTDDTSQFFAFASTITPQCTKLSPTVLVHECNAISFNVASHHNVVRKFLVITADVNKATSDTIEAECNSDNSHILKDDQSYTDSTNDEQDDCVSNKVAGPIIFEATTAFVENGPPWMPLAVNIQQCEWLPWDTSPFYTTDKASPHQSTPKQKQSKEVSVSGRNDGSTKNVHHFSCAPYLRFLQ